jgi:hypothetical protein
VRSFPLAGLDEALLPGPRGQLGARADADLLNEARMQRSELKELHHITPIRNVVSILERGILSHVGSMKVKHHSVASDSVLARRAAKRVPGGRPLLEYVNLYFHARNPMMYLRRAQHRSLCVLCVSPAVLDLPDVVVTDRNAASDYCRFSAAPDGLAIVDQDRVFARDWTHLNEIEAYRRKSKKCAEVLVPDSIDITFVIGAYVSCTGSAKTLKEMAPSLVVTVSPTLFFL